MSHPLNLQYNRHCRQGEPVASPEKAARQESIMKKVGILFGLVLTLLSSASSGFALPGVDIEAALGGWMQSPSGDFSYVSTEGLNALNSTLDLEKDLRYDDEKRISGRIKIELPIVPSIYVMASPMMFEGNGLKDVDFWFGDTRITQNIPFYSKITLNQYDVALYYGIPFLKTASAGKMNVDIGINARIMDAKAEIRQDDTAISESKSATLPIPTLFLAAQFAPIERLALEMEGRGLAVGDNKVFSLIGRLRVKVIGPAFIAGGYRYDSIDIDENDVKIDTKFAGPFLEAGVKF